MRERYSIAEITNILDYVNAELALTCNALWYKVYVHSKEKRYNSENFVAISV